MSVPIEAIPKLISAAARIGEAEQLLREARAEGRWENWREGSDVERNAIRDLEAACDRSFTRIENLVNASAAAAQKGAA